MYQEGVRVGEEKSLDVLLDREKQKKGTVIHNSFLEKIDEDGVDVILQQPSEVIRFNYMAE